MTLPDLIQDESTQEVLQREALRRRVTLKAFIRQVLLEKAARVVSAKPSLPGRTGSAGAKLRSSPP